MYIDCKKNPPSRERGRILQIKVWLGLIFKSIGCNYSCFLLKEQVLYNMG